MVKPAKPAKTSDIMWEFANLSLKDPDGDPSSEAFHAALLFAHLGWNLALGYEAGDYGKLLAEFARSRPQFWSELRSSNQKDLIEAVRQAKGRLYPDDRRVILVCGTNANGVHVEWCHEKDYPQAGRLLGAKAISSPQPGGQAAKADARPRHDGPLIRPSDFAATEEDKVKLNWFLFEYALEVQSFLRRDKKLCRSLQRKGVTDADLAAFCIHHAKTMKAQILDRLKGRIHAMHFRYEPIEAFFPRIGDRLVDQLLTVVGAAWDSKTSACEMCPTRCISERDRKAFMFDDPSYAT